MRLCLHCQHIFDSTNLVCPGCGREPIRINDFTAYAPELASTSEGFKPEYFSELARHEPTSFWFRARNQIILWALRKYQPNVCSFLEVGCGTGFVLSGISAALPGVALSGSEIFIDGLPYAAARVPTAHFMQLDARHIPFVSEFDAIGAFDVLEHIKEDETVLGQLYQALKSEGVLLLTVPQHPWLWSAADDYACHVRRYMANDIHSKLVRCGFKIERSTSFVSLLLPVMLLSRLMHKQAGIDYDPLSELRVPVVLNTLFHSLMWVEQGLIRLGVNMPLGGSRLIVARKVG